MFGDPELLRKWNRWKKGWMMGVTEAIEERDRLVARLARHGVKVSGRRVDGILEDLADRLDGIAEVVNKAAQELWTLQSLAEQGGCVQEGLVVICDELVDLNLPKEGE